jgi:hypothetical protein
MAFAGRSPDAVVRSLSERWKKAVPMATNITGAELDDVARAVIREPGYDAYFVHCAKTLDRSRTARLRTAPDNFETANTRALMAGRRLLRRAGCLLAEHAAMSAIPCRLRLWRVCL